MSGGWGEGREGLWAVVELSGMPGCIRSIKWHGGVRVKCSLLPQGSEGPLPPLPVVFTSPPRATHRSNRPGGMDGLWN